MRSSRSPTAAFMCPYSRWMDWMRVLTLDSCTRIGGSDAVCGVPTRFCRSVTYCCSVLTRTSFDDPPEPLPLPEPLPEPVIDFITVSTDTFTRFTSALTVATWLCTSSSAACVDVSFAATFRRSDVSSFCIDGETSSEPSSAAGPGVAAHSLRTISSSWRRSSISCMMFWFMMEE